ncbi:MAG: carbohydrate ABC transporter permease [Acidimicrobiales bacterium]
MAPRSDRVRTLGPSISMSAVGLIFLVPFVWLVATAFKTHGSLTIGGGGPLTLKNFQTVLHGSFLSALGNSMYLAIGTTVLTTVIGIVAAYPLSRYKSRAQIWFVYALAFMASLPIIALMIPTYDFYVSANLINSKFWAVWFLTATSLPFATWVGCSFIDAVPKELEEAAWIDGNSRFGSLRRVVMPLIIPGLCVIAVYTFVNAWGNFFVPLILLSGSNEPASVTIYGYFSQYGVNYGQVAAFALLYSLPPVLLYLGVTRWVGSGFALGGAIKG